MNFSDYRHDELPLTLTVLARMEALGVAEADRTAAFALLAPLSLKGEPGRFHSAHCLRVGLLASEIAACAGADAKALLLAGMLHDVGKALVPACTLGATSCWTPLDQSNMEGHVLDGFRLLRDRFDFTAQVILWHHRFQAHPYPEHLPEALHPFSKATLGTVRWYGYLLMVADVYDALHRVNSASGGKPLAPEEIKAAMLKLPRTLNQPELVNDLYAVGVLA